MLVADQAGHADVVCAHHPTFPLALEGVRAKRLRAICPGPPDHAKRLLNEIVYNIKQRKFGSSECIRVHIGNS